MRRAAILRATRSAQVERLERPRSSWRAEAAPSRQQVASGGDRFGG